MKPLHTTQPPSFSDLHSLSLPCPSPNQPQSGSNWCRISIEGLQATEYLQRITTFDATHATLLTPTAGCILSAQGRINFFGLFTKTTPNNWTVDSPLPLQEALDALRRLHFRESLSVEAAPTPVNAPPQDDASYYPLLPSWPLEINTQTNPLEIGLGISLAENKGCYPGQEVMERMITQGSPARRLAKIAWSSQYLYQPDEKLSLGLVGTEQIPPLQSRHEPVDRPEKGSPVGKDSGTNGEGGSVQQSIPLTRWRRIPDRKGNVCSPYIYEGFCFLPRSFLIHLSPAFAQKNLVSALKMIPHNDVVLEIGLPVFLPPAPTL